MCIVLLELVQFYVMQEFNDILEKQFFKQIGFVFINMGGLKCVVDIMNFFDMNVEFMLMEGIKDIDEELVQEIFDMMFVFDNLGDVDDCGIQVLLCEVFFEFLILVLKGVDENVKEKIFGNMFKCVVELFCDDLEVKGLVKFSEVEIV